MKTTRICAWLLVALTSAAMVPAPTSNQSLCQDMEAVAFVGDSATDGRTLSDLGSFPTIGNNGYWQFRGIDQSGNAFFGSDNVARIFTPRVAENSTVQGMTVDQLNGFHTASNGEGVATANFSSGGSPPPAVVASRIGGNELIAKVGDMVGASEIITIIQNSALRSLDATIFRAEIELPGGSVRSAIIRQRHSDGLLSVIGQTGGGGSSPFPGVDNASFIKQTMTDAMDVFSTVELEHENGRNETNDQGVVHITSAAQHIPVWFEGDTVDGVTLGEFVNLRVSASGQFVVASDAFNNLVYDLGSGSKVLAIGDSIGPHILQSGFFSYDIGDNGTIVGLANTTLGKTLIRIDATGPHVIAAKGLSFDIRGESYTWDNLFNPEQSDNGIWVQFKCRIVDSGGVSQEAMLEWTEANGILPVLLKSEGTWIDNVFYNINSFQHWTGRNARSLTNDGLGIMSIQTTTAGRAIVVARGISCLATRLPEGQKLLDGEILAGNLMDVFESDDVDLHMAPVPTSNPVKQKIDWILQGTSHTANPDVLKFVLESQMFGGPAGDVTISIDLFNYDSNSYETIHAGVAATTDTVLDLTVTGDRTRFVQAITDEMTARMTWQSVSFSGTPFTWNIDVDQAVWQME